MTMTMRASDEISGFRLFHLVPLDVSSSLSVCSSSNMSSFLRALWELALYWDDNLGLFRVLPLFVEEDIGGYSL